MFTVGTLVKNLLVCGVLSLSHRGTPHIIGARRLNLGFFCPNVCDLSHFEDLIRSFGVYPAITVMRIIKKLMRIADNNKKRSSCIQKMKIGGKQV